MKYKHLFMALLLIVGIGAVSCKYDDDELWEQVNSLNDRLTSVEAQLPTMNSGISSLSTIINQMKKNVSVTKVETTKTGYVIHFSDGKTATISNGKDGLNGKDGQNGKDAPIVGIGLFEDEYYWNQTIDGKTSWLVDKDGNKLPVTGKDAITPLLKVNVSGFWMVSYDGGINYTEVIGEDGKPIKAVGQDGAKGDKGDKGDTGTNGIDGTNGLDGDSFFSDVQVKGNELIITLKDGTILKLDIKGSIKDAIAALTGIVPVKNSLIPDWDKGYVTSDGYFLYKKDISKSPITRSSTEQDRMSCVSFMPIDESYTANLFTREDGLPSQLIVNDDIYYFSFLNDTILEVVQADPETYDIKFSIKYDKKKLLKVIESKSYKTEIQELIAYMVELLKGSSLEAKFKAITDKFNHVLEQDIIENPTEVLDELEKLGLKEGKIYIFETTIKKHYQVIVTSVRYSIVLWTGKATFKVGGSSCTLSGTVYCASNTFNDLGTYGILCDKDPKKLICGEAEFEGIGKQDKLSLNFDVDFRGFKPNTKYYYRAFYKFNSADHGKLNFKYGKPNAQIGYDSKIKSFTTGDNRFNVDVVMCIDITGSMGGIINTVKANALSFYDAFKAKCDENKIELSSLGAQVIAFQDINVDGDRARIESKYCHLPAEKVQFDTFIQNLYADGGGDYAESGLEALDWSFDKLLHATDDGYHRQVVILWTDAPYLIGSDYTKLTPEIIENKWNTLSSGRRLILFAPNDISFNGGNWNVMDSWKNVIHSTDLTSSFSDFDYILDNIIGELTGKAKTTRNSKFIPIRPGRNN